MTLTVFQRQLLCWCYSKVSVFALAEHFLVVDRLRFQKQSFVFVFVMFPVTAVHLKKTLQSVSSFASIAWSKT